MHDDYRFRDEWLHGLVTEFPAIEPHLAGWRTEQPGGHMTEQEIVAGVQARQ